MRIRLLFILLVMGCMNALAAVDIEFDSDSIYVGYFTDEDYVPEATFFFCGVGNEEIEIRRIEKSCQCDIIRIVNARTEAEYVGYLIARIDLRGLPNGKFYKNIYLYTNAGTKRLVLYGEVNFPQKVLHLPAT